MTELHSRGYFTAETEYDAVRVNIRNPNRITPNQIDIYKDGRWIAILLWINQRPLFEIIDRRIESGEIPLSWETPAGVFADGDVPDWLRPYVDLRNIFARYRSTPLPTLTQAEERRAEVEEWAVENSEVRAIFRGFRHPARMGLWLDVLRSVVAAAQTDSVITGRDWHYFQNAMKIDVELFMDRAQHWSGKENSIRNLSELHTPVQSIVNGPVVPIRVSCVSSTQLSAGRAVADGLLFGAA